MATMQKKQGRQAVGVRAEWARESKGEEDVVGVLTRGVGPIERCGVPGVIHMYGNQCVPVAVSVDDVKGGKTCRTVVAATSLAKSKTSTSTSRKGGRVLALSHEGYIDHTAQGSKNMPNARALLRNGVAWLCGIATDPAQEPANGKREATSTNVPQPRAMAVLGKPVAYLQDLLCALKLDDQIRAVDWHPGDEGPPPQALLWMGKTGSGDVCELQDASQWSWLSSFVTHSGGGLLVAMCPWGFEQITDVDVATQCAQNHVLRRLGLVFGADSTTGSGAIIPLSRDQHLPAGCRSPHLACHAAHALYTLIPPALASKGALLDDEDQRLLQHETRATTATSTSTSTAALTTTTVTPTACEESRGQQRQEQQAVEGLQRPLWEVRDDARNLCSLLTSLPLCALTSAVVHGPQRHVEKTAVLAEAAKEEAKVEDDDDDHGDAGGVQADVTHAVQLLSAEGVAFVQHCFAVVARDTSTATSGPVAVSGSGWMQEQEMVGAINSAKRLQAAHFSFDVLGTRPKVLVGRRIAACLVGQPKDMVQPLRDIEPSDPSPAPPCSVPQHQQHQQRQGDGAAEGAGEHCMQSGDAKQTAAQYQAQAMPTARTHRHDQHRRQLPGVSVFPCMGWKAEEFEVDDCVRLLEGRSCNSREWVSTGLYLPPNTPLHIYGCNETRETCDGSRSALEAVQDGEEEGEEEAVRWRLRVGCHTDKLWHLSEWKRWPEISHTFALEAGQPPRTITHPWGGMLYLEHNSDGDQTAEPTTNHIIVKVSHATPCARFSLEMTDKDFSEWLADLPRSPWCELESKHCIFTIPSLALMRRPDLNTNSNLQAMLSFWDKVLVSHYELVGRAPPCRKERVVVDVQISAGYMHAGYPVMIPLDQVLSPVDRQPMLLDAQRLEQHGSWGLFHEFGHHIQDPRWTFEGTGEVTVNFFTLYSMEQVVGIEPWHHPWLQPHKAKAAALLQSNASVEEKFDRWKQDPCMALVTYARLQAMYGWGVFKQCLALYDADTDVRQPGTEEEKINTFAELMSQAVGADLCPYFQAWGWPVDASAWQCVCPPLDPSLLSHLLSVTD